MPILGRAKRGLEITKNYRIKYARKLQSTLTSTRRAVLPNLSSMGSPAPFFCASLLPLSSSDRST